MRAYELLLELAYGSVNYGSWVIKYEAESKNGLFKAMGHNPKVKGLYKGEGSSYDEAIQQVKDQIDQQNDAEREKRTAKINPKDVTKVEIAFNRSFTREIIENEPTAGRFIDAGGKPQLLIMTSEYFRSDDVAEYISTYNMIRMQWIIGSGGTEHATDGYSIALGPRRTIESGLEFGGRYYVDEVASDDDVYRKYDLMLDSISQGGGDMVKLKGPGLTVATWIKGGKKLS